MFLTCNVVISFTCILYCDNIGSLYIFVYNNPRILYLIILPESMIACGYPDSVCCLTASEITLCNFKSNVAPLMLVSVIGLPTSLYEFIHNRIGPTLVWNKTIYIYSFSNQKIFENSLDQIRVYFQKWFWYIFSLLLFRKKKKNIFS